MQKVSTTKQVSSTQIITLRFLSFKSEMFWLSFPVIVQLVKILVYTFTIACRQLCVSADYRESSKKRVFEGVELRMNGL